jgi:hypothetical protein
MAVDAAAPSEELSEIDGAEVAPPLPIPMIPKPLTIPIPIISCDPLPFTTLRPARVANAQLEVVDNQMDEISGSLMMNEETPFEGNFGFWF